MKVATGKSSPPLDVPPSFLRAHESAIAKGHCNLLPAEAMPGMARAQIARDRSLAQAIGPYAARGVVLLTGNGHARTDVGVPYWLAFGLFTGLVAVVPFFGTLVSTLLPALFVVGAGDWVRTIAVILLGVVVHLVEANFVVPRIMQRQVALPPVLTIASVLIMATLLGPIGLIVAVPVLAVTLVVIRHVLQGEIYGESEAYVPAVLRTTGQHRATPVPLVP